MAIDGNTVGERRQQANFGGYTNPTEDQMFTILVAEPERRAFVIQNLGAGDLYLGFGSPGLEAESLDDTNGLKLGSGETFADEGFTGEVIGYVTGAITIRYAEFG